MSYKSYDEKTETVNNMELSIIPDRTRDVPIFDNSIKEDTIKKINDIVVSKFIGKLRTKYVYSSFGRIPLIDSVVGDIERDLLAEFGFDEYKKFNIYTKDEHILVINYIEKDVLKTNTITITFDIYDFDTGD